MSSTISGVLGICPILNSSVSQYHSVTAVIFPHDLAITHRHKMILTINMLISQDSPRLTITSTLSIHTYICMYVCLSVYVCMSMSMSMSMYTYTYTYTYRYMCMCMCMCMYMCMCMCMYMYMYMCMYMCMCMCMYMYIYLVYIYMCVCADIPDFKHVPTHHIPRFPPVPAPGAIRREQWPGASFRKRFSVGAGSLQSLLDFSWCHGQRSWQIMELMW